MYRCACDFVWIWMCVCVCIYRSQTLYVRCYCVIRSECKRFLWRIIWIFVFVYYPRAICTDVYNAFMWIYIYIYIYMHLNRLSAKFVFAYIAVFFLWFLLLVHLSVRSFLYILCDLRTKWIETKRKILKKKLICVF